eukprot:2990981-Prymnesium_polylepis.1
MDVVRTGERRVAEPVGVAVFDTATATPVRGWGALTIDSVRGNRREGVNGASDERGGAPYGEMGPPRLYRQSGT